MIEHTFIALSITYLGLVALKSALACFYVHRRNKSFRETKLQDAKARSISIVQPILSGDPRLKEMLESNLRSVSEQVEFYWLIDEDDSEAQAIASELSRSFPNVRVLPCPNAPLDQNPKAFKLQTALENCERDVFVVLDDDTRIEDDSLVAALASLEHHSLYTGLPIYESQGTTWSKLLAHFVNNNSLLTYLPTLNFASPISINGMFYAIRTPRLKEMGGFRPILERLCDDHAIYSLVTEQGGTIDQGISFQRLCTSIPNGRAYFSIMHRWNVFAILLIKAQKFWLQLVLVVLLGLPACIFGATTLIAILRFPYVQWPILVLLVIVVVRHLLLKATMWFANAPIGNFHPHYSLAAVLLQPIHALFALVNPRIRWRHRRIRVSRDQQFLTTEVLDR